MKTPTAEPYFAIPTSAAFLPGITQLYGELHKLPFDTYPLVILDVMRTFLEKVIKSYADSSGVDIKAVLGLHKGVQLADCLKWLHQHLDSDPATKKLAGPLKKLMNGQLAEGSAKHLNSANHNHMETFSSDEVRTAWVNLLPVFAVLMPPKP